MKLRLAKRVLKVEDDIIETASYLLEFSLAIHLKVTKTWYNRSYILLLKLTLWKLLRTKLPFALLSKADLKAKVRINSSTEFGWITIQAHPQAYLLSSVHVVFYSQLLWLRWWVFQATKYQLSSCLRFGHPWPCKATRRTWWRRFRILELKRSVTRLKFPQLLGMLSQLQIQTPGAGSQSWRNCKEGLEIEWGRSGHSFKCLLTREEPRWNKLSRCGQIWRWTYKESSQQRRRNTRLTLWACMRGFCQG